MMDFADKVLKSLNAIFIEPFRQLRWSYAPPLMVYLSAGLQGLSAIVGTFFIKDYLSLPASFLAGLAFWAGLPWAMKMPLGHLVDLMWRWKALFVYLGAILVAASLFIMYALIARTDMMRTIMFAEAWFVLSALMAPVGYVIQDVVADAMTVEAIPNVDERGIALPEEALKAQHTTMQTLGRFAIILGLVIVAAINITMFSGVGALSAAEKIKVYGNIYLLSVCIPVISVLGVILNQWQNRLRLRKLIDGGLTREEADVLVYRPQEEVSPNWWILAGSVAFVAFVLTVGLMDFFYSKEIVFAGSALIISFLLMRLIRELSPERARMLLGTAIIVFVFRAVPLPGPGIAWFEIDVLGFDERFLSVLSLITSVLALAGMILLRPLFATQSIAYIVVLLSVVAAILSLPNIGLYYGVHQWTAAWSGGVVDAHFIAILDTAIESPLSQIAMIPLLAWIARNAPAHLKATFFAVLASFVNLALSASSLMTKYLNQIFVVTRQVKDAATGGVRVPADYSALGILLIVVAIIGLLAPLAAVYLVQNSKLRTTD